MTGKFIPVALVCMLMLDVTFGFLPLYAVSREDESREEIGSSGSTNVRPPPSGGTQVVSGSSSVGVLPSGGGSGSVVGGSNSLGPCDDVCTKILEPLCGNDGRSYNNMCILKNASCRSQLSGGPPITVAFMGFCNTRG